MVRSFARRFCAVLAAGAFVALGSVSAHAQTWTAPTGALGWETVAGYMVLKTAGSPDAACRIQHSVYAPNSVYLGWQDTSTYNHIKACLWNPVFGDSGSSTVDLKCASGYALNRSSLLCEAIPIPTAERCDANGNASPAAITANPIDILRGAKRFDRVDFATANGDLVLRRQTNTQPYGAPPGELKSTPKGLATWLFDFQYELQITNSWLGSNVAVVATPSGSLLAFKRNASGAMIAEAPLGAQIDYKLAFNGVWPASLSSLYTAPTTWTLTGPDNTVWTLQTFRNAISGLYDIARPVARVTPEGYAWTLVYSSDGVLQSLTDSFGKQLTFNWLTGTVGSYVYPKAISEVTLPGGRKLAYTYESASGPGGAPERLMKVELKTAAGAIEDARSYVYENATVPLQPTGEFDALNVRRWSVTYDAAGRATKSAGPGDAFSAQVAYGAEGATFTRTVTNALGKQTVYNYAQSASNLPRITSVAGQVSTHCPASASSYSYGADRLTSSSTDEEGRITTYTRNANGQPTQIVEGSGTPLARTTTITWHPTLNEPAQVVGPARTINLSYGGTGQLTSYTETDTTTHTVPYATNGRQRTWTYGWSATGRLLTVDGPLSGTGDALTYAYDANGYLASVTAPMGLVSTVTSVDWRGAPLTVQDANGVQTTMTYDAQGRPLTITIDPGTNASVYVLAYNAVGDLTKLTLPTGGWLEYSYDDARRLTGVLNDRGETQAFVNNAAGRPTSATTRSASSAITRQQTYAYDELARVIQAVGAGAQVTAFAYDKVSNLTTVTDARSKISANGFDALNRLVSETDPQSKSVGYAYNGQDQLTTFVDGEGRQVSRKVDGFGRVIQETSPDRGVRTYWYDNADNITKLIDGDAEETNYTYDAAGRPTGMTFVGSAWETMAFTYDSVAAGNKGKGRLTGVTEASGTSTLTYDAQGRLTKDAKVIRDVPYDVIYAYDASGKITQLTLPSGRSISYTRAPDGLITGITTKAGPAAAAQTLASAVAYQPFGPLKTLTYGNGLVEARSHDQNYWLSAIQVAGGGATPLSLSFGRNPNGQVTSVSDSAGTGRDSWFGYTDAGRLQYGVGPWEEQSYSYDGAGNRKEIRTVVGGVTAYEFAVGPGTNNRITQVQNTNGTVVRNLGYRNGGDLWGQEFVGGSSYVYSYDSRKRLVMTQKDGLAQAYYGYDFRGQRVWRQLHTPGYLEIHYIYDQDGHLLAEHNGDTGAVLKQYVWLGDTPLAVIDRSSGSDVIYYVHTGQQHEPLVMTNAAKAKVWDVYVEPFGRAQALGTVTATLDLRLPGQWAQLETGGFSQNWMRDYDPSLGRYIQADPIGLGGGQNMYAYVDGRPTELTDPKGEAVPLWVAAPAVGGLVGGGASAYQQYVEHGDDFGAWDRGEIARDTLSGAATGFLMVTPWGYTRTGAFLIGMSAGGFDEMSNPCLTGGSLVRAMAIGGVAGLIGGRTKASMAGRMPTPLWVTDPKHVIPAILPDSIVESIRQGVGIGMSM